MQYDGAWKLTLPQAQIPDLKRAPQTWPSPLLANGKLSLLPGMNPGAVTIDKTLLTAEADGRAPAAGQVFGNAVRTFTFGTFKLFHRAVDGNAGKPFTTYDITSAALHMDTGTFTEAYDVRNYDANASSSSPPPVIATIARDTYVARQYPYVAVQSVTVRIDEAQLPVLQNDGHACFFHEMHAPPGAEQTARYDSSFIFTQQHASVYMFTGASSLVPAPPTTPISTAPHRTAVAACYLWDAADSTFFEIAGFNVDRLQPGVGYNRVNLYDGKPVTVNGTAQREFKFHVLACAMTDADYPAPDDDVRRVVLAAIDRGASSQAAGGKVHVQLRTEHTQRWNALWKTNVTPLPKAGITVGEMDRLTAVKRHVRYALYNMYSSIRGGATALFNAGETGVLDLSGRVSAQGDVWFVPCLLLLNPEAARSFLDARGAALPHARRLAATYGFRGAMFPYAETVSARYTSAVHWDAVAVTHVFNTAAVGVNVWNYYRVTRDRDWLRTTGFPILKGVADFVADAFAKDAATGEYVLSTSVGLSGVTAEANAFSTNVGLLALKAGIEGSYAVGFGTHREWTAVFFNTASLFFQTPAPLLKKVIKFDASYQPRDPVRIAEPLLILSPPYSEVLFPDGQDLQTALVKNYDYYKRAVADAGTADLPFNAALACLTDGLRAQADTSRIDHFYDELDAFLKTSTEPKWGNFRAYDGAASNGALDDVNDVSMSSLFLLLLLNVAANARIVGGVTDTQFTYGELRLNVSRFRKMPRTWLGVRVSGLGTGMDNILVTNELTYKP